MKHFTNKLLKISSLILIVFFIAQFGVSGASAQIDTPSDIEFLPGELELAEVPNFDFGKYIVWKGDPVYNGIATTTVPGSFVVDDARGDNSSGWNVSVSLGKFSLIGSTSVDTLSGAKLQLNAPTVVTYFTKDDERVGYPVTLTAGDDNYYKLFSMPPNAPSGSWIGTVSGGNLSFSTRATVGTHVAKLMWRIENTP